MYGVGESLNLSVLVGTGLYFVTILDLSLLVLGTGPRLTYDGTNQFVNFSCFSAFLAKERHSLVRLSLSLSVARILTTLS